MYSIDRNDIMKYNVDIYRFICESEDLNNIYIMTRL